MPQRLTAALLLRNEASLDRFLRPTLARCQEIADTIVVLDDGSTDDTVEVCEGFGAIVRKRTADTLPAWGNEASARAELWDFALEHCPDKNSWLLVLDGDMLLHGDPRPLMQTRDLSGWAWPLFDVWDEKHYREDQFWRGHQFARVWFIAPRRVPDGWQADWSQRGIHPGHLPQNLPLVVGLAPPDIYWLHMAFSQPRLREEKHRQYLSKAHLLNDFEKAHADSILSDPTVSS